VSDELHEEIRAAVGAILKGRDGEDDFDRSLWKDLCDTGFHLLGVPEEIGGSGGGLRDLAVVVDLLAFHGARVPVAESAFLAGWLLARAGLSIPDGVVVASIDQARVHRRDGLRLSGRVRAPWARHADHVMTTTHDGNVAVSPVSAVRGWIGPIVRFWPRWCGSYRCGCDSIDCAVIGPNARRSRPMAFGSSRSAQDRNYRPSGRSSARWWGVSTSTRGPSSRPRPAV
jgi:hypothetical protein